MSEQNPVAGDPGRAFRALHEDFFIMPNPWDGATAAILADLGFKALASSSAALAWSLGRPDGAMDRDTAVAHAAIIARQAGLPVNGDFEAGYGETPHEVGETMRAAIGAGVAGCSVEDLSRGAGALYEEVEACRRIEAARAAIDAEGSGFVLTGRCEAFLAGDPAPLTTALARLKAYAQAGADALYAPGLTKPEEVEAVVALTPLPVNILAGLGGVSDDLDALRALGVKRISLGPKPRQGRAGSVRPRLQSPCGRQRGAGQPSHAAIERLADGTRIVTADDVHDLFAPLFPVTVRKMFGGLGVYCDGAMFALVASGEMYVKADEASAAQFHEAGCEPFVYDKGGKAVTMSYWRLPAAAYDDEDALRRFASLGVEAAARADAMRRPKGVRPSKGGA